MTEQAPSDAVRFERAFLIGLGVGGTFFHAFGTLELLVDPARAPLWWVVLFLVLVAPAPAVVVVLAWRDHPRTVARVLRVSLVSFAVLSLLLLVVVAPADDPEAGVWIVDIVPIAAAGAAVVLPRRAAWLHLAWLCLLAALVPWRSSGGRDPGYAIELGLDMLMVGVLVIAMTTAVQAATHAIESATSEAVRVAAVGAARDSRRRERERVAALVHDEILATLLAVSRGSLQAAALRETAARTRRVVAGLAGAPSASRGHIGADALRLAIERRIRDASARARIEVLGLDVAAVIPDAVAVPFLDAAVQAVRNADEHATVGGRPAAIVVEIGILVTGVTLVVRDDGQGFDAESVGADRLGVRSSIVGRVQQVDGASAIVAGRSASGGTEVRLTWVA